MYPTCLGIYNDVELSYINVSSLGLSFHRKACECVQKCEGNGSFISEEITEHITPSTATFTTLAASARRWSLAIVPTPGI